MLGLDSDFTDSGADTGLDSARQRSQAVPATYAHLQGGSQNDQMCFCVFLLCFSPSRLNVPQYLWGPASQEMVEGQTVRIRASCINKPFSWNFLLVVPGMGGNPSPGYQSFKSKCCRALVDFGQHPSLAVLYHLAD